MSRGFSLLETTFAGVVLLIGTMTLIAIGRNMADQVSYLRNTLGQPAIAEQLIDAEIQAIEDSPTPPAVLPMIAPIGLDATGSGGLDPVYQVFAASTASVGATEVGLTCYAISVDFDGQPFMVASPSFGPALYSPPVKVCRD